MRWLKTTTCRALRRWQHRKAKNWCRVSTGGHTGFPVPLAIAPKKMRGSRSAQSCQGVHATWVLGSSEEKASVLLKPLSFSGNELTLWCVSSMEIDVSWSFCPPDSFSVSILFCHKFLDDKPKGRLYFYSKHKLTKRTKSLMIILCMQNTFL